MRLAIPMYMNGKSLYLNSHFSMFHIMYASRHLVLRNVAQ